MVKSNDLSNYYSLDGFTRNKHLIKYSATGPKTTGFFLKYDPLNFLNTSPQNSLVIYLWALNVSAYTQVLTIYYCTSSCDNNASYTSSITLPQMILISQFSSYEVKLKFTKLANGNTQIKSGDDANPGSYNLSSSKFLKFIFNSEDINISNIRIYVGK